MKKGEIRTYITEIQRIIKIVMKKYMLSHWKIEKKWTNFWAFMTYYN